MTKRVRGWQTIILALAAFGGSAGHVRAEETPSPEEEAAIDTDAGIAASGGGCSPGIIGSCISYAGQYVHSDFYLNIPPDGSRCSALLQIWSRGNMVRDKWYSLTHTGHYDPISFGVATQPPSKGYAFSRVIVYTCSGNFHHYVDSPRVYYP